MFIKKFPFVVLSSSAKTFVKFGLVAVTSIVIELSAYTFLFSVAKLSPVVSSPIGQVIGLIVNFSLNKIYTFEKSKEVRYSEFFKYLIVWIINLGFSTVMIQVLTESFPTIFPTILRFFIICIAFFFNFFALKFFVFKN